MRPQNYRRNITINNTANSNTLTDYQVAVNLTYNSHMQPDFSDIRFTYYNSTSGTETGIPYWIENYVSSSWAYVWVKVPYIPANGYAYIYVYYGNTTPVTSASNGTATFVFFDDYTNYAAGSALGGQGGWTAFGSGSQPIKAGGNNQVVELTSSSSFSGVYRSLSMPNSIAVRSRIMMVSGGEDFRHVLSETSSVSATSDGYHFHHFGWSNTASKLEKFVSGSATVLASVSESASLNTWYVVESEWYGSTFRYVRDGVLKYSASDTQWSSALYLAIGVWTSVSWDVDWTLVRKYTSPEPTYSIGTEEVVGIYKNYAVFNGEIYYCKGSNDSGSPYTFVTNINPGSEIGSCKCLSNGQWSCGGIIPIRGGRIRIVG